MNDMKTILRLIPAVLALAMLMGCTNDETAPTTDIAKPTEGQSLRLGNLQLNFDPFDDEVSSTRALRNNNFGQLTFQESDLVNVYNEILQYYDIYAFRTDGFYYDKALNGGYSAIVTKPKYAILRGATKDDIKGYIHRSTSTYRIDVAIPRTFVYDANAEQPNIDGRGTPGFRCDLPMFGYADFSSEGDYIEVANLRYLVAVLRIDISGLKGNVRYLRLTNTAGKALSGSLTACMHTNPADRKQTYLQVMDDKLTVYPDLYIDMTAAPSNKACVYLPVVAGLDGTTDGVKLEYSNDASAISATTATGWTEISSASFTGMSFAQHKRYTVTAAI